MYYFYDHIDAAFTVLVEKRAKNVAERNEQLGYMIDPDGGWTVSCCEYAIKIAELEMEAMWDYISPALRRKYSDLAATISATRAANPDSLSRFYTANRRNKAAYREALERCVAAGEMTRAEAELWQYRKFKY